MIKIIFQIKRNFEKAKGADLGKRLVSGISWSLLSTVLGKGLVLIAFIFVARILGKETYGKLGIIRSTLNMFLTFSSFGMAATATRYIALYRKTEPQMAYDVYRFSFRFSILLGILFTILLLIFSSYISINSLHDKSLVLSIQLGALIVLFTTICTMQSGAISGFEDFKQLAINNSFYNLAQGAVIVVGAYYYNINGAILGLGFSMVLFFFLNKHSLNRLVSVNLNSVLSNTAIDKERIKNVFFKFTLPSVLSGLLYVPVLWWSKTYLVKHSGYGAMAMYDVSEQWYTLILFVPFSISAIILPMLSNIISEGTKYQYKKLIKINLLLNGSISIFLFLIVAPFSSIICKSYGTGFTDISPFIILIFSAIFNAVNNVLGQVIASMGKMWIGFCVNVVWAVSLCLFTVLFVNSLHYGAMGLALSMLLSYVVHSVVQYFVAIKMDI